MADNPNGQEPPGCPESARLYEELFEQSVDGIILISGGKILRANPAFCAMNGYTAEELIGSEAISLVHPDDRPTAERRISSLLEGEPIASPYTYRVVHRDGRIRWVETTSRLAIWGSQEILQTICRDVTERQQTLCTLRESEAKLREIVEHSNDAIVLVDSTRSIVSWNPSAERIFRIPRKGAIGMTFPRLAKHLAFSTPEGEALAADRSEILSSYFEHGDTTALDVEHEIAFTRPEDTRRRARIVARPILTEGGRLLCVFIRDVTEEREAEATLRESEARYRSLFDSMPIGLYRTTPEGTILDANPALVEILGYPDRETLLSMSAENGYEKREARCAWRQKIERDGQLDRSEAVWRTYDGPPVWIEEIARVVRDEDGRPLYYEGSATNISDQKRVEQALAREKAYFEQLFAGSPEAVVLCDDDGTVLRVNREFTRLFGYSEAESVGRHIDTLVAPKSSDLREEAKLITDRVTAGEQVTVESIRQCKDRSLIDVSVLAQPIFVGDQQVGVYSIYRDIGPRKAAEEALRLEKARFEQLYEASPEAIVLCTNESEILRVNTEFTRLFGHSKDEAVGEHVDQLLAPESGGLLEEARALTHCIAGGETSSLETIRQRKDGSLVHVSILGKPIRIDGEQVAVYGIYRDITAQKEAEAALAEARHRVEQLHEAAGRLERAENEDDVYRIVMEAAEEVMGFSHCALDVARDGLLITQAVSSETPKERIRRIAITRAGIAGETYREGKTTIDNDVRPSRLSERSSTPIRSLISVPIRSMGVFQAAANEPNAFDQDDARHLEILLGHAAEALGRLGLQQELIDQAIHDPLTGLFNRHYFNEVLEQETLRATRYDHPFGLLMIDVNRFKEINDTLGHPAGDDVLREIACVLRECIRETDFIVRYGGDEFLIVLTETGEEAVKAAERIRTAVRESGNLQRIAGFPVTVSVGTTAWRPDSDLTVELALARADERMYEDKRRG
jgi:diguanylate cyclase (GGDEF)-like protein/PAS domain S-box-containing protein